MQEKWLKHDFKVQVYCTLSRNMLIIHVNIDCRLMKCQDEMIRKILQSCLQIPLKCNWKVKLRKSIGFQIWLLFQDFVKLN